MHTLLALLRSFTNIKICGNVAEEAERAKQAELADKGETFNLI